MVPQTSRYNKQRCLCAGGNAHIAFVSRVNRGGASCCHSNSNGVCDSHAEHKHSNKFNKNTK